MKTLPPKTKKLCKEMIEALLEVAADSDTIADVEPKHAELALLCLKDADAPAAERLIKKNRGEIEWQLGYLRAIEDTWGLKPEAMLALAWKQPAPSRGRAARAS